MRTLSSRNRPSRMKIDTQVCDCAQPHVPERLVPMAYALGISAVARLRPGYASLVGLGEVLSTVAWAWLLVAPGCRFPGLTRGVTQIPSG